MSDKTISKWETGKGYPDITLLEPIAKAFSISVTELISGNTVYNSNVSANMLRSRFYICPICGNVIHSMGEAVVHCHGVLLKAAEMEKADENHKILIEKIEDEYYVRIEHEMSKNHYISFIAAQSSDRIQMVKLYPEGNAEARVKISGVKRILFYCNRDGLFYVDLMKKSSHSMEADKNVNVKRIRIEAGKRTIPALIVSPKVKRENVPCVLWIHGGGYFLGMKEMVHISRAIDLVKNYGAVVIAPGYRLAFQKPYPAAIDVCG